MAKRIRQWYMFFFAATSLLLVFGLVKAQPVEAKKTDSVQPIKPKIPKPNQWTLVAQDEFDGEGLSDFFVPKYLPYWNTNNYQVQAPVYDGKLHLQIADNQPDFLDVPGVTSNGYKVSGVMGAMRDFVHMNHYGLQIQDHQPTVDKYVTKYGYFEIRAKMQGGSGMAPAWWMVGFQDDKLQTAEIDIFEVPGKDPSTLYFSLHPWDDPKLKEISIPVKTGKDLSADFHVYGFEWDPAYIRLYIDGVQMAQIDQSPDYRMMTILSMTQHENNPWLDPLDPNLPDPKDYQIDYYRVFKKTDQLVNEPTVNQATYVSPGENLAGAAYASISDYSVAQYKMNPPYQLNDGYTRSGVVSKDAPSFPQYLYLDWTSPQTFDTVGLSCDYCQGQGPTDWEVQLSEDGITNWTTVAEVSDMKWTHNSSAIETKEVRFAVAQNKKFLRIKINGANLQWGHYSVNELLVYHGNNIAWHAAASGTGLDAYSQAHTGNINDGQDATSIVSIDQPSFPQYVTLTWDQAQSFESVALKCNFCKEQAPVSWDVEVSEDGSTGWTKVASSGQTGWRYNTNAVESEVVSFPSVSGKKAVRIKINSANLLHGHFAVNEIEVYRSNLAMSAKGTGTGLDAYSEANLANMNDGDDTTGIVSVNNLAMPQYVTLRWGKGQSFGNVTLKCKFCQGQGLKNWKIEVSDNGETGWQTVASSGDVQWKASTADTEARTINFEGASNKKGMRIKINDAYLEWGHYAIYEIEVR